MLRATSLAMIALLLAAVSPPVQAQSAWVSDQFEIMLRTGPSTSNAIQLQVESGTRLAVLERDAESGYTRVRTPGGTEGWVLTRYLMSEPSAREQLQTLTAQLTDATAEGTTLQSQLGAVRSEYDTAIARIDALERDKAGLERELGEIRRTAADVLSINQQNEQLREQLTQSDINRRYAGTGEPRAAQSDAPLLVHVWGTGARRRHCARLVVAEDSVAATKPLRSLLVNDETRRLRRRFQCGQAPVIATRTPSRRPGTATSR